MKRYFLTMLFLVHFTGLVGGGITLYEISPSNLALASAGWTARALDPATVFTNPAGMTHFCRPTVSLSAEPIYIHVKFDPDSDTDVSGDHGNACGWIPAGGFYYVQPLGSRLHVGFGSLGYFGSALYYNKHWVGRYYLTKAVMQGFSAALAASYQLTSCLSVGVAYTPMYAIFKQVSRINNVLDGMPDGRMRLKDDKFGHGFVAGILYEMNACTRFGVQYLSRNHLDFKDTPTFINVGPTLTNFLNQTGLNQSPVLVDIRVPQSAMFGFYHAFSPCFAVMGDVGWQQWSRFGLVEITLSGTNIPSLSVATKYSDGWHVAFGTEYRPCQSLTLLTGVAYDSSVVSFAQRTFNFPVGMQWRFGVGMFWCACAGLELEAAYELSWTGDLPCDRNRGPLAGRVSGDFTSTSAHFMTVGAKKCF